MVERAIARESARQIACLEGGGRVGAETLLWDDRAGELRSMRSKEDAPDYRYFPEPDLAVLRLSRDRIARARAGLPELPFARRDRFAAEWDLPAYDASVLTESLEIADFFEDVAKACGDGKLASNWTMGEVMRVLNEEGLSPATIGFSPIALAELLSLVRDGTVSASAAKTVFTRMRSERRSPREIVAAEGLTQMSDTTALVALIDQVIARHPRQVEQVRAGEEKVLGFLVGQAMKASGGTANPALARKMLAECIAGRRE